MGANYVRTVLRAGFVVCVCLPGSATAQHLAANAPAETSKAALVTVNVREVTLDSLLRTIARQAGLRIYVPGDGITQTKRVSMHVRALPASDAFAQALAGTELRASVTSGLVFFTRTSTTGVSLAQGTLNGTVIDAKTRRPIAGATIALAGTRHTTTTGDDGTFRIATVTPGSYTVNVRMLGYVKAARTVAILDDQVASIEIAIEPSVNALDQVVVTGTVVATAQREIPNAMTVITGKDLEQRGITKIDQLFRGDVPGVFVVNVGAAGPLDEVVMFSRGATALVAGDGATFENGQPSFTNPMKTYVDGVELADPRYLSQIDPKSIERIEIVTGPQASTIYGSNAINGVMQVFTKRGTSARPQFTATLLSGWVENDFRPTRTPQHDDAAQVTGVEGHWAYNAGGSWNYLGPWTPGKQTSRLSGFGGARVQRGPITVDGSLRLATTRTRQGGDGQQGLNAFRERGLYTPSASAGFLAATTQTLVGQTLGLSLGLTPVSWWSHVLVFGDDRSAPESRQMIRGYKTPTDTLLTLTQRTMERRSVRYTSTVQVLLASVARAVITLGADGWQNLSTSLNVGAGVLTGTLTPSATPLVRRQPGHNAGGFLQTQVGLWDQLFVTYGLRGEWNPTYGEDAQPNWALRIGMAYTRDVETPFGPVTAKLRASYGRSTRPPAAGARETVTASEQASSAGNTSLVPWYGDYDYVIANPELGPEQQQGGEGGIELFLGRRGSLVVTRYNQTVVGLIVRVPVDSVRSLDPNITPTLRTSCDVLGYCYNNQYQNLNVGSIRNQGWELQGTVVTGPLTTRGTYSWTKSRTIGVSPQYRKVLTGGLYVPGVRFNYLPEHTWSGGMTYARARSTVAFNVYGTGMLTNGKNTQYATGIDLQIRLNANRVRLNTGSYAQVVSGSVLADLDASQRFSSRVEGVLQVQNLGDVYTNGYNAWFASLGRQTKLGLRLSM